MGILARHNDWVAGCTITESCDDTKDTQTQSYRRFTATIRGWRNWRIWEGLVTSNTTQFVIDEVRAIRQRIDENDKSVFN